MMVIGIQPSCGAEFAKDGGQSLLEFIEEIEKLKAA
jgi:hypothetical protein